MQRWDDLRGRRVLVTGASSGIGSALAAGFGAAGAHVCVHYNRDRDGAQRTAANAEEAGAAGTLVVQGDFTTPEDPGRVVAAAAEAMDGLDVLVNNAGDLLERRAIVDVDDDYLDATISLNFASVVRTVQRSVPYLRQSGGAVVNVSSLAVRNGGGGHSTLYGAAKGAVDAFTRGAAKELASDQIRVNAVAPGPILTPFHERNSDPEWVANRGRTIPLGRVGQPVECVGAVLFLASNAASGYVTGQVLHVNGGALFS